MTNTPHVSIVLPAYNEAQRISSTLEALAAYLRTVPWTHEVLVVDDGSLDTTVAVVERTARNVHLPVQLLRHARNRGKGAAVRTGMAAARGLYAVFADADHATPFSEMDKLLAAAAHADIVIGSRYLPGSDVRKKQSLVRRGMSRAGNMLFRVLLGLWLTDTRCGFKLFSARARSVVFPRQTLERWGFDTEVLVIAQHAGLTITEVPVIWYNRVRGNIHPLRDSLRSLGEIFHIRAMLRSGKYNEEQWQ